RILRLPHEESTLFFRFLFLTPRCIAAVAVSVDAHYRDQNGLHNHFFNLFFRSRIFPPLR
ncbi:hypothetical protein, partial [Dickeya chrysanthemi]|uniref:hypothetical protein n=1 Tax=Dickeya chrysanthemi TaxID=556 RepID=UPI001EE642E4